MGHTLDNTDRAIIDILQQNARTPNVEIARQVNMAPSAVCERIRKLEEKGVIRGYNARIDADALNLGLTAFILVRTEEGAYRADIGEELAAFPEVLEVHSIAGEDCYLVKVKAHDTHCLTEILRQRFGNFSQKIHTRTTIVLDTMKETSVLPMDVCAGPAAE